MRRLAFLCTFVSACAGPPAGESLAESEHEWSSEGGNPLHATHTIFAEYAVDQVAVELPEVGAYAAELVKGANLELHETPLQRDTSYEALRREIRGSNWAAERPELLWEKARERYAAGDKAQAYLYVGILLHYVQDMGVPAHAFHVIHQNRPWNWDNLEVLGFWELHGDLDRPLPSSVDPRLDEPTAYIAWSGARAREHFRRAFPGAVYRRTFFPQAYDELSDAQWTFLRERQASSAHATAFALRSAALGLGAPAR